MKSTSHSNRSRMLAVQRAALAAALAVSLGACAVVRDQQSAGAYVEDSKITAEIKTKMAADRDVAATAISVETLNGVTQLSGFAKSQAEKDRAASIARQASGVRAVRNDVIVRP